MPEIKYKKIKYDGKNVQVQSAIEDQRGNDIIATYSTKEEVSGKQDLLINEGTGQNIKTVNGNFILGTGDLDATPVTYIKQVEVDGNTLKLTNKDDTVISFTPAVEGGITDVKVNGTSVVTSGVANITDMAKASEVETALGLKQDKSTLETDVAAKGFTKNEGTITEIKMNGSSKGTSGVVDLGTIITDVSDKQDALTAVQLNAVNSGITATKVGNYDAYDARITTNTTDIATINTTLSGFGDIVTHDVDEFATAAQGAKADSALQQTDIIDNVTSSATDKVLSAKQGKVLQDQIDNLKARGRYLSDWNAQTGKPSTDPAELPYTYHSGDYYIITNVGTTNYRPTGTQYTGEPSTTEEPVTTIANGDFYHFDGSVWILSSGGGATTSFSNITGDAMDNSSLAGYFNVKVNTSAIVDNLTTDDATKVLSAKQGKALNDAKQDKATLEEDVAEKGFTKNEGTITGIKMNGASKGSSGEVDLGTVITDVSDKQDKATLEADVAAKGFTKNEGTITGITMNGSSKGTSGVVDLGTVITEHQDISGKQDKLIGEGTGQNIKTINGENILGTGDITIEGGASNIKNGTGEGSITLTANTGTVSGVNAVALGTNLSVTNANNFVIGHDNDETESHLFTIGAGRTQSGTLHKKNILTVDSDSSTLTTLKLASNSTDGLVENSYVKLVCHGHNPGTAHSGIESVAGYSTASDFKIMVKNARTGGSEYTYYFDTNGKFTTNSIQLGSYPNTVTVTADEAKKIVNSKVLDTTSTTTLIPSANENILDAAGGTIQLHKIAKTGSYNDLLDKPDIPNITAEDIYEE